jgi:ABC-type lipoprotein export system ATPase subunit
MYHLLKGLHEHLTRFVFNNSLLSLFTTIFRKEEFSVIIIGLDAAGKTTLLEKIKTLYNETPGLSPDKIGPTVGQNSTLLSLNRCQTDSFVFSWKDSTPLNHPAILGSRRPTRYSQHLA